eukprot:11224511-Lingulodinium_polyedra.AAC.1
MTTACKRHPRSSSTTAGATSPRGQTTQYRSCPACGRGILSSTSHGLGPSPPPAGRAAAER